MGKDKGNRIGCCIYPIAVSGSRPAIAMISVSPASGGIGKSDQVVIIDLGKGQHIATGDVEDGSDELIGIGYVDWDGLLDILQGITEYPDRQITCGKTIIVSEIGEYRKQLDLIVAGNLEDTCADIEGQLRGVYDTCKEQQIIPIDCRWNLKVHLKRNYKLHQIKDEQDCLLKERSGGTNERSENVQPSSVTGASVKEPASNCPGVRDQSQNGQEVVPV